MAWCRAIGGRGREGGEGREGREEIRGGSATTRKS